MKYEDFKQDYETLNGVGLGNAQQANIIARSADVVGSETKYVIAMEELAELAQIISKYYRDLMDPSVWGSEEEKRLKLLEEMADVEICLDTLVYLNNISVSELQRAKDVKLIREAKRRGVDYTLFTS